MKKFSFLFLITIFLFSNSAFAFQYCEQDKIMFYDAFIDGYITEMQKNVDKLNIKQEKKDQFMELLKQRVNREYLIKSSWNCIQAYPIKQIVSASVICTADWSKKQHENNKDLFELLKD